MNHSFLREAVDVCRHLNRRSMSAFPTRSLPLISLGNDDEYENYDYDVIGPRQRKKLLTILEDSGFKLRSARELVSIEGTTPPLRFPRPNGTLGVDPSGSVLNEISSGGVVWATPTQTVLCLLHQSGGECDADLENELVHLVREQPANLGRIKQCARSAGFHSVSELLKRMARAQAEGIELRKRREFRSELPI